MVGSASVVALALQFLLADIAAGHRNLNLTEGSVCKTEGGAQWRCQQYERCATAKASIERGISPDMCGFTDGKRKLVICCKPLMAKQKCEKYAEAVITKEVDAFTGQTIEHDRCAAIEPLVAGGVNAAPREFPHQALLGTKDTRGQFEWACGGSLISERFVLSAAHCTYTSGKRSNPVEWARLGDYNINANDDDKMGLSQSVDYKIIERIDHPKYTSEPKYENDIALYKLEKDVTLNEFIRPICLHTEYQLPKLDAIATGFGKLKEYDTNFASVLQKVNLTIRSYEYCNKSIRVPNFKLHDDMMLCAENPDPDTGLKSTCKGDSGGPLQVRLEKPYCMYNLLGVVSLGTKCITGVVKQPSIYTRVSHYVPWIESIVWP